MLYDLSGPFAAAGSVASQIGAQIAIDLTNERGGVLGKYKVEAVNADSQSKPDVAINEGERLINQEHVDAIVGVYSSAAAVPLASKVEEQKKILWITTAVATSVFKDRNLNYVFRAQIHSDQYGQAGIGFLTEHAKPDLGVEPKDLKVAIIYEDGPYGTGVAAADEQYAKQAGIQIVLKEAYSANAPDLSSLVTKLKRARPDVILHAGYNPDITLFLRQAREAGLRFKMLIGNGAGYSQLDKLTATFGTDIDNFCDIDPVPAQHLDAAKLAPGLGDLIKIMVDRYKAKTGANDVPPHVSMGFNQTWILLQSVLAGRHPEIWRHGRRSDPQSGARCRYSGRRDHSGIRRQILPAGHSALRPERTLDPGRHAIRQRADQGRLADRDPERAPGPAVAGQSPYAMN